MTLKRPVDRLVDEDTEMHAVASAFMAFALYGGVTGLVVLYFMDTSSFATPLIRSSIAIATGVVAGTLLARFRLLRGLLMLALPLLFLLRFLRAF